jgi:hypothetical protein
MKAAHKNTKPKGEGFGAKIRSIEVDGQTFDLQGGPKTNAPPVPAPNP